MEKKEMQDKQLQQRRKEMNKSAWIANVLRIYPNKTRKETEELYDKLFTKV